MMIRLWTAPATRWVLLMAVVFILLLDFYGLSVFPVGPFDPVRFGSLGSWFQGLLTVAVVAIAALTLKSDREKHAAALRDRLDASLKAERSESGRVYSWLERRVDEARGTAVAVRAILVNDTTVPIYDWTIEVEGHGSLQLESDSFGPLLPGVRHIEPDDEEWQYLHNQPLPRVSLRFVASNGETLSRTFRGQLEPLKS